MCIRETIFQVLIIFVFVLALCFSRQFASQVVRARERYTAVTGDKGIVAY